MVTGVGPVLVTRVGNPVEHNFTFRAFLSTFSHFGQHLSLSNILSSKAVIHYRKIE